MSGAMKEESLSIGYDDLHGDIQSDPEMGACAFVR